MKFDADVGHSVDALIVKYWNLEGKFIMLFPNFKKKLLDAGPAMLIRMNWMTKITSELFPATVASPPLLDVGGRQWESLTWIIDVAHQPKIIITSMQ